MNPYTRRRQGVRRQDAARRCKVLPRHPVAAVAATVTMLLAACGGAGGSGNGGGPADLFIALNVPSSADPFLAAEIQHGAQLAVTQQNHSGVVINGVAHHLVTRSYDDAGQAQQAAANVQSAIHDGAFAVIEDGIGASATAQAASAAGVPEIVIANGDTKLLDPQSRPSLFRLGIANDADATILGKYIAGKAKSVSIIHDDTENGRNASSELATAMATANIPAQPVIEVAATASTIDTQVQQLASARSDGIAIEGGDAFTGRVAAAVRAAGLRTPLFAGPFAEFPAVRAAAGPAAEGLSFASSRLTSESDETAFAAFEKLLVQSGLGCSDAGVATSTGTKVRQPDDYAMYAYDAVNVAVAALKKSGNPSPGKSLLSAMTNVRVKSANGDNRGFAATTREGISDDDIYIAVIHDNQFQPAKDEPLSATLPSFDQNLADCTK